MINTIKNTSVSTDTEVFRLFRLNDHIFIAQPLSAFL